MECRVTVGYTKFKFKDVDEAIKFAEIAKNTCEEADISVSISIVFDKKEV